MTLIAGVFLVLFGAVLSWFLAVRFANANLMRIGYGVITLGGVLFVVWSVTTMLAFGIAALFVLLIGGLFGVIGALRRELRITPPA